jgi:hypothetical protein
VTLLQRIEHAYNWLQGCRFFWVKDDHPSGGYLDMTEKCCPYPLLFDWSVKACNKAGLCGCNKGRCIGDNGK